MKLKSASFFVFRSTSKNKYFYLIKFLFFYIQVSQIEFNRRAPAGCTQYFMEPTGKYLFR